MEDFRNLRKNCKGQLTPCPPAPVVSDSKDFLLGKLPAQRAPSPRVPEAHAGAGGRSREIAAKPGRSKERPKPKTSARQKIITFEGRLCCMNPAAETKLSNELVSSKARVYRFSVVIEKDKDGYFAFSPQLQGCYSQGDTYEEALENIRDAIRLHVEDRLESGEEVPQPESVSLTSLEVAV